jgi:hypothetical protein
VYILVARHGGRGGVAGIASEGDATELLSEARWLATLLTLLLISALLILLFVLGAYLIIRIGQFVARERVGGTPTAYVDAWQKYRLTDEQIAAATSEDRPDRNPGEPGPGPAAPPPQPPGPAGRELVECPVPDRRGRPRALTPSSRLYVYWLVSTAAWCW